ncbi:hypothetical protein MKX03_034902, partial [Papaver bracteatum]
RKRKTDYTHSTPSQAVTISAEGLSQREVDMHIMLTTDASLGTKNVNFQLERCVFKRRSEGIYILNLGKTLEKLMMAARVIASMDNAQDVIVQTTSRPYDQRDVLRFSHYSGAQKLAGRHTQDTFTNRMLKFFTEPCSLVPTDTRIICQSIKEAALRGHLTDET